MPIPTATKPRLGSTSDTKKKQRGRGVLARRLARRGLTLSGGIIATALAQKAASASVPLPLVTSTVKAASLFAEGQSASAVVGAKAAALTQGVLKAMLLAKIKIATAVVLVLAALDAAGTVLTDYSKTAAATEPPITTPTFDAPPNPAKPTSD